MQKSTHARIAGKKNGAWKWILRIPELNQIVAT